MLNPQEANGWFVDLSSPAQFEDKNGSFALILSYFQTTPRGSDELNKFFKRAGANYVMPTTGAITWNQFNAAFILGATAGVLVRNERDSSILVWSTRAAGCRPHQPCEGVVQHSVMSKS